MSPVLLLPVLSLPLWIKQTPTQPAIDISSDHEDSGLQAGPSSKAGMQGEGLGVACPASLAEMVQAVYSTTRGSCAEAKETFVMNCWSCCTSMNVNL
jgi:hypothetical protein